MQFISLYTPAVKPSGPPSAEHMEKMGKLMIEMMEAGRLVATGGLGHSAGGGMRITLNNGKVSVQPGPFDSTLQQAAGWAILKADSKEQLQKDVQRFLEVAGDGECDLIQVMEMPPPG